MTSRTKIPNGVWANTFTKFPFGVQRDHLMDHSREYEISERTKHSFRILNSDGYGPGRLDVEKTDFANGEYRILARFYPESYITDKEKSGHFLLADTYTDPPVTGSEAVAQACEEFGLILDQPKKGKS